MFFKVILPCFKALFISPLYIELTADLGAPAFKTLKVFFKTLNEPTYSKDDCKAAKPAASD